MRASLRFIVGIAALVMLSGLVQFAEAQCIPAVQFGTWGGMNIPSGRLTFDTTGASNTNFTGRFYQSDNTSANNGACDASSWWLPQDNEACVAPNCRKVQQQINSSECPQGPVPCPSGSLTLIIEDTSPDGSTAFYVAMEADETNAEFRIFDLARVDGTDSNAGVLPFPEFPKPVVTGSGRTGQNVDVQIAFDSADQAANNCRAARCATLPCTPADSCYEAGPGCATGCTDSAFAVIDSYDLVKATGTADPGRDRSLWSQIDTVPFEDAFPTGSFSFSVPCDDTMNDAYIAIGMTFQGGVASTSVSEAVALECDPNLADPETTQRPTRRPTPNQPRKPTSVRGGGR